MIFELSPQQQSQDVNDRCGKAMAEIKPILEKYQLEFAARLQPTEAALIAMPILKDMKFQAMQKSPIQLV